MRLMKTKTTKQTSSKSKAKAKPKGKAKVKPKGKATSAKYVYFFGRKTDGNGTMKPLLGGKGANLAEMCRIGLPVPPGFTITTDVCTYYYANQRTYPDVLRGQMEAGVAALRELSLSDGRREDCFLKHSSGRSRSRLASLLPRDSPRVEFALAGRGCYPVRFAEILDLQPVR